MIPSSRAALCLVWQKSPPRPALARRAVHSVGVEDIGLPDLIPLGRIRNPAVVQSARNTERVADAAWQLQRRAREGAQSCPRNARALPLCDYHRFLQRNKTKLRFLSAPWPHPAPALSPGHWETTRRRLLFSLQQTDGQLPERSRR